VILISNRLPVTLRRTAEGPVLAESHGGVATGLAGVHALEVIEHDSTDEDMFAALGAGDVGVHVGEPGCRAP
jgi:hypothetical protein